MDAPVRSLGVDQMAMGRGMHRLRADCAAYAVLAIVFVGLDAVWLTTVAGDLFQRHAGAVLRETPDLSAAFVFYVIYAGALLVFAVRPALEKRASREALVKGALLGLTAYATFDLTNLAIIKGWNWQLALIDIGWGTIASAVASACGYWAASRVRLGLQ